MIDYSEQNNTDIEEESAEDEEEEDNAEEIEFRESTDADKEEEADDEEEEDEDQKEDVNMIHEESEEGTCSKTTHTTTDMCEYDNDDSTENEDHDKAEKDTIANLNEEIQEQDIEMILEESPKQDTKEKLLKSIDNSMANFKNKQNNNEEHTDKEDTDWNDNQPEQTVETKTTVHI